MRLVHVAGLIGSGKTSVIHSQSDRHEFCLIANNKRSSDEMKDVCPHVDDFPYKSPCARIRQYKFRLDMMLENQPDFVITEPPGNCLNVSSPMLNPIYIKDRGTIELGPLITVFNGPELLSKGVSKRTTDGLRAYNMIDESDAVIISYSEILDDRDRSEIRMMISDINEDAEMIFFSKISGEGVNDISDLIFSDSEYHRPLVY